jgi:hypothetical protein
MKSVLAAIGDLDDNRLRTSIQLQNFPNQKSVSLLLGLG